MPILPGQSVTVVKVHPKQCVLQQTFMSYVRKGEGGQEAI